MRIRWRSKNLAQLGVIVVVCVFILTKLMSGSKRRSRDQSWQHHQPHIHEFDKRNDDGKFIVKRHEQPLQPPQNAWHEHILPNLPNKLQQVFRRPSSTVTPASKGPKPELRDGVLGNFEKEEPAQSGPGEMGKPVHLSMEEKAKGEQSVREYGFNMVVSGKISMDRTVPDIRMPECKYWQYPTDLPSASVVLVFHNEGFGVVMRTVHSIFKRSPLQYLHEVVLIDDQSDYEDLGSNLDNYIKRWNGKVKVYRNSKREGLIRARTIGAEKSTGDVVIFLDSHCEVNHNWLVPLLAVIRENRKVMAVPIVDGIDAHTFEYRSVYQRDHYAGIFEWGFLYKESKVPEKELKRRKHNSEPYNSPTHAGGLFAIDRLWFQEMGYYDSGLEIWGGEQYELSFKIWQCGGGLKWVPCSRVGHIYRMAAPRNRGAGLHPRVPLLLMNHIRVIETWFDDKYKEYFYRREPLSRDVKVSDISKQLAVKEKLHCKNFTWFMENVAYELEQHYPHPPPNKYWGEIKQLNGHECWDANTGNMRSPVGLYGCHSGGGNQLLRLNVLGQLGTGERCIGISSSDQVIVDFCGVQHNGDWSWDPATHLLKNSKHNKCVELVNRQLLMKPCDGGNPRQYWVINEIHPFRD